ncbi:uncharacterized protein DUF2690 [Streptomyces sp. 2333.5]|uniref:DUF2690 domain-containing protein n=1 Tax=Streptomyces TaxID=1883 RepID=UPI000897DAE6|nr:MULTISPECIES: DUF2690 domain-containing protein [unclassified Streptomyces]PJJ06439.1 uncharacterized protein DUF2690 [Streptomyces sp. 2333.5]SEE95359.1 Protein of unknown function [Streptomyces sp. 2314.4]SEF09882.1 Protein of unknown function [Streptomyces sp. 2112.2]SOE09211.1 Protein of unknown function [Streptomyces sp. 2323.1]
MSARIRLAVTAAAGLLLTGSVTVPVYAAPAEVTAHCSGSGCAGKSPSATGCDRHARTVRRTAEIGPLLELRYSPTCRAAWVRVTRARAGDRIEARNKGGAACRHPSCYAARVAAGRTSAYTAMVNDKGIKAWACLERRNGNIVCTEGY